MASPSLLLTALQRGPLVFDGAMGTALYERGLLYTANFDEACLTRPEVVSEVHASYVRAGAQVLETNTFGANRIRLAPFGLGERARDINQAAVRIALEAAAGHALVLGAVGPTGMVVGGLGAAGRATVQDAFAEQCEALAEAGAQGILLETFRQPEEIALAMAAARERAPGLPLCVQVSFDAHGALADGAQPETVAAQLVAWGADVVGVNCAEGPAGVFDTATRMLGAGVPVIAQPNAGLPRHVEGRLAYMATPDYFMVFARRLFKAGIRGVGGCCGTTPEHVRRISSAARMVGGGTWPPDSSVHAGDSQRSTLQDDVRIAAVALADKGALGAKLGKQFVVSVEVNPPQGLSPAKALEAARLLKDGGVDAINVADGARASARMGNLALCLRIQEQVDLPTLMHVTTRDRNLLGLVAHLLCAHELGVRNLVMITGDPPKMGDFPDASAVYDLDSVGLIRMAARMNRGVDPGGKSLGGATSFLCATGAEPAAVDYERELVRVREKCDAGAELIMTQPVYDPDVLERFLTDVAPLGVPVMVGILPLASHRNAEFLHHEVPGMAIPEGVRARMERAGGGETGRAEGVAIAREMLMAVKARVAGAYIMPPLGQYALALRVIDGIV